MEMQSPKQYPSPLMVGVQCALAVLVFACVVLDIHYFPEYWLNVIAAHVAMINSLVVPWWLVLVAVCVHMWTVGVIWRLRGHPNLSSKGHTFFRSTFKNFTEGAALMLLGLHEYLDGMDAADIVLMLSTLFLIPRLVRLFFCCASPK